MKTIPFFFRPALAGVLITLLIALLTALALPAHGQEFDREPINYSKSRPDNRVSRLQERLEAGQATLKFEEPFGYLRSLLRELQIPPSSQMLVFSKTSLQRQRISPSTPRALYFNDDLYVGYCQNGEVLEISVADPALGAVFYTLEQAAAKPKITRQGDNCLICHGSSQTRGIPGHLVRSVFPDAAGLPILSSGSFRIDQTSPLEQRWGGWYVTGLHGKQKHLGNLVIRGRQEPREVDNSAGMNLLDLGDRFDKAAYLTPHSDIVALLVLEHQTMGHNLITRANFLTREALHYETTLNRQLAEPAGKQWDSTVSRIKSAGEPLVEYLLFSEEAPLMGRIQGTSVFSQEFVEKGPRDSQGRSLHEFDLNRRLFRFPCSYLVYSPSFAALPKPVKEYVLRRIGEVLTGRDQTKAFAHLSANDRLAIKQILLDTLPDLPQYWRGENKTP